VAVALDEVDDAEDGVDGGVGDDAVAGRPAELAALRSKTEHLAFVKPPHMLRST